MDKYQQLRADGQRLVAEVQGKTTEEAHELCKAAGFAVRYYNVDGRARMITADVRMDRIGFDVCDGLITNASVG